MLAWPVEAPRAKLAGEWQYAVLTPAASAGESSAFHRCVQLHPHDTLGHQIPAGIINPFFFQ